MGRDRISGSANEGLLLSDRNLTLYLHTAANTAVPCLQALIAKGCAVSHYFLDLGGEKKWPRWSAEMNGERITAEGLEEVLGLIAR